MDESNIPSFMLGDFDPNYVSRSFPTGEYDATGSAPTPPVMEPPAGSEASGTMSGSASTNTGSKRSRTSGVWQHFDEVAMTGPDGRQVTFARCRICKNKLSAKSSGGTGHLKRHAEACAKKQGIQLRQQQLLLNPDGTGDRLQRPPPVPAAGKKKLQWSRIWGGSSSSHGGGTSSSAASGDARSHGPAEELSNYLDSDAIMHETSDFNVLGWWNDHKMSYPVLSKLARDVLTVPVSSVSSESVFSLCGRIIEDRRTSLSSDHVEILLSVKDWELAAEHAQYTADNQELAAQFENLYLDDEQLG
ncbi:uncharacterized protein [Oryza sativa Japonica Group]|uniref:uncharacterized protein n=1 Tax=Oryza sativa subsp. japonica TaxID=39947 RepID=UPI00339C04A6